MKKPHSSPDASPGAALVRKSYTIRLKSGELVELEMMTSEEPSTEGHLRPDWTVERIGAFWFAWRLSS
jgi:hypothetical protein